MAYKHIIFDFDGVLVETNTIRLEGFRLLFRNYPQSQLEKLIRYCRYNAGKSRYEKIQYFFNEIRHEVVSPEEIQVLAKEYSAIVKQKVIAAAPVKGSLEFLTSYANNYDFAIVSGSDHKELQEICRVRKIDHFFVEMLGSPISKEANLAGLLSQTGWKKKDCLFVGDSINDLDAAGANGIDFIGRNSNTIDWNLVENINVVDDFSQLELYLS